MWKYQKGDVAKTHDGQGSVTYDIIGMILKSLEIKETLRFAPPLHIMLQIENTPNVHKSLAKRKTFLGKTL